MTRKKTTPATPANNAAKGVAIDDDAKPGVTADSAPGPGFDELYKTYTPAMFGPYVNIDDDGGVYRLPDLPGPSDNRIGHLADVFFLSGYFGKLTPAQIAVQLMAGKSLGMSAIESMYNLELGPDAGIRYTPAAELLAAYRQSLGSARPGPVTPEPTLSAAETGDNVRPFPGSTPTEPADLANKGDLSDRGDEIALPRPQGSETTSAAPIPPGAAAIEPEATAPAAAEPDPAVYAAEFDRLRERIAFITKQFDGDAIAKVKEFEQMTVSGRRAMIETAEKYYSDKLEPTRTAVLDALIADGKPTTDEQQGFFIYAEVPGNPADWTLKDARKANAAIAEFIGSGPKAAA